MTRLESAKAMAGCCVFCWLLLTVICEQVGFQPSPDQSAFAMMVIAVLAAAWLCDPPPSLPSQNGKTP
jgi:hypothetical protein